MSQLLRHLATASIDHREEARMTVNSFRHDSRTIAPQRDSRLLATIVFVPCFAVLLVGGAITRLIPGSEAPRGPLLHEARAAAYDCVAFALMG